MSTLELKHLDIFDLNRNTPEQEKKYQFQEMLTHINDVHMRAKTAQHSVQEHYTQTLQSIKPEFVNYKTKPNDALAAERISRAKSVSYNNEEDYRVVRQNFSPSGERKITLSKTNEETPGTGDTIFSSMLLNILIPGSGLIEHIRHGLDTIHNVSENSGKRINLVFTDSVKPDNNIQPEKPMWKIRDEIHRNIEEDKKKKKKKSVGIRGF